MSVCPSPTCLYQRSPDADEERLDDELILLHRKTLQVRVLNSTATVLWDAMVIYHTAQELADLMLEAWPAMDASEALAYATQFLDSLTEAGFAVRTESEPASESPA